MTLSVIHFLNWFYSLSLKMLPLICFRKLFFFFENTSQLDPTRNPIDPFKNELFWPTTHLTYKSDWLDPIRLFARSKINILVTLDFEISLISTLMITWLVSRESGLSLSRDNRSCAPLWRENFSSFLECQACSVKTKFLNLLCSLYVSTLIETR